MAGFSWFNFEIDFRYDGEGKSATAAQLEKIPQDINITPIFAHEYIHFITLLNSVAGVNFILQMLELAIAGTLEYIDKKTDEDVNLLPQPISVLERMKKIPKAHGRLVPNARDAAECLWDQWRILMRPYCQPYYGEKQAWDYDGQDVLMCGNTWEFNGLIFPCLCNPEALGFQPFSPGMLAEGLAKRVQSWLKVNMDKDIINIFQPTIPFNYEIGASYYNGIYNILCDVKYSPAVDDCNRQQITALICQLALCSSAPAIAVAHMLDKLSTLSKVVWPLDNIVKLLSEKSSDWPGIDWKSNQERVNSLQSEPGQGLNYQERYKVFELLKKMMSSVHELMTDATVYCDPSISWQTIKNKMQHYSLPPIIADCGNVTNIDEIKCINTEISEIFKEVYRVFFSGLGSYKDYYYYESCKNCRR